jgi:hypothetical protein
MRPEADILIQTLDQMPRTRTRSAPIPTAEGQAVALADFLDEDENDEHPYFAVTIRRLEGEHEPVAWVELLSPSNNGSSADAYDYRIKRRRLVQTGLAFVELDFLHERPPTFRRLRDYARGEPGAYPYRIVVLEPNINDGYSYVFEFDADARIPTAPIPLAGDDVLHFDFDAAYQKMFVDSLFGYDMDYARLPPSFDRYSPADQARIARRMLAVLEAARAGVDLETAALEPEEIPLAAALERLQPLLEATT